MPEPTVSFDDGAAYERFMGRWSRAVGKIFLDWLAPPQGARWLDVGCGTGAFTQLVLDTCAPGGIVAVDPSAAQVEHARQQPAAQRAEFRVADAMALPFSDGSLDVVASALVINFIPDRAKGLSEMRRVSRPGGIVAGYVWDFAAGRSVMSPLQRGLRDIGADAPRVPGASESTLQALTSLFTAQGLKDIAAMPIDVTLAYRNFDDFWDAQSPIFTPTGKIIAALPKADRARLRDVVRVTLPPGPDGTVAYSSRANAIKAHVP